MDKYIKQGIDIVSNNRARIESEIARIDARIEKVAGKALGLSYAELTRAADEVLKTAHRPLN